MKSKKIVTILAVLAALAIIVFAAWKLTSPAKKTSLRFPTAATTGTLYPLGAALAERWNADMPGVRVTAQASAGGVDNLNFLRDGEAELGVAVTSIASQSYTGSGAFENAGNPDLRVIAGLYYNPNQIVVRADSGINSLNDVAGKRFAPGAAGSTTVEETQKHFTAAGLDYPGDINAQYVGFTEAIDLMLNRQLDGAWIMAGIPTSAVTQMCSTANGRLIPIDDEVLFALQKDYPWYVPFTIPANTYPNQTQPIKTTAIKMVLVANKSLPDDIAYGLAKSLWTNIDELSGQFHALDGLTAALATTDLAGIPLHDGAAKYYAETTAS